MTAPLLTPEERARLARLALRPRRRLAGDRAGERSSGRVGQGALFQDHRPYTPGDDPRYVDWHVAARLGDLVVKRFEAEENLDLLLAVDRSLSMQGAKGWAARRLAAALGHLALDHLDRVLLAWLPGDGSRPLAAFTGPGAVGQLLAELARVPEAGRTDLRADLERLARRQRRRALAFVVSDFFDPHDPPAGLRRLRALGHEVVALHVLDPADAALPAGAALRAVDAETGQVVEMDVTPELQARVQQAWRRRAEALARWCAAHDVAHVRVDVGRPLWDALRSMLARGLAGRR